MNCIEEGKKPPKCKSVISTPEELVEALRPLIGQAIPMTGKSTTQTKRSASLLARIYRYIYCYNG